MFNTIVKKVAVVGVSFGLLASPMAFAHMSIDANQDISVNDEPIQAQSHRTSAPVDVSPSDLMYDVGERPMVIKAESTHSGTRVAYKPKDLIRDGGTRSDQQ